MKEKKAVWAVYVAAALLAFPALASIKILEPAEGAIVPLHTDVQKAYIALPAAERRAKFADAEFRKSLSRGGERLPGEKRPRESFWPRTVRLAWKGDDGVAYKIEVRDARNGAVVADGTAEGTGAFENAYPGLPLRERLEKYVLSLGFTMDDIEKFRRIMLEGYAEK